MRGFTLMQVNEVQQAMEGNMSSNVRAEAQTLAELKNALALNGKSIDISIRWRPNWPMTRDQYRDGPVKGCIVDATTVPGQNVPMEFTTAKDALAYLGAIIGERDRRIDEAEKAERAAAEKAAAERRAHLRAEAKTLRDKAADLDKRAAAHKP